MVNRHKTITGLALGAVLIGSVALAAEVIDVIGDKTGPGDIIGKPVKIPDNQAPDTYAEETGYSPTADTADTADSADEGSWADEGGVTPTADHADEGGTATYAPTGDSATNAPSGGTTLVADYAGDVAECAGGPFMGGDCGDMRYDGRLGLGSAPQADLDVAGDAWLNLLVVSSEGSVAIGGAAAPGGPALRVHGNVRAEAFERENVSMIDPVSCRAWGRNVTDDSFLIAADGWIYSDSITDQDPLTALSCPVGVPVGARVLSYECFTEGTTRVSWEHRKWHDYGHNEIAFPKTIEGDEVHLLRVLEFDSPTNRFGGCAVRWRMPVDVGL